MGQKKGNSFSSKSVTYHFSLELYTAYTNELKPDLTSLHSPHHPKPEWRTVKLKWCMDTTIFGFKILFRRHSFGFHDLNSSGVKIKGYFRTK